MIEPIELLYEPGGLPVFDLPDDLVTTYGGTFGLPESCVYANFVQTIDGVVAVPSIPGSNKVIAGGSLADRFVMGLLRACADVLMIGSGTMNASPKSVWTAEQAYPDAASSFAELRRRLGKPADAEVAIVTASGSVDPAHPAFAAGAIVLTTDAGAATLRDRLPAECIVSAGPELTASAIIGALTARGHRLIHSEGGPHAISPLIQAGLVDELFLTVSPLLAGRPAGEERYGLIEGADLLTDIAARDRLLGVRRDEDHLFLRYALTS